MLSELVNNTLKKIKKSLAGDECSYCQGIVPEEELFCMPCQDMMSLRPAWPITKWIGEAPFRVYCSNTLNDITKRLLYAYKFYNRREHAGLLSDLLVHYWTQVQKTDASHEHAKSLNLFIPKSPADVLVVPTPTRWSRGHIEPFARRFASEFGYNYSDNVLGWARETKPQHILPNAESRLENMRSSMMVNRAQLTRILPDILNPAVKAHTMKATSPLIIVVDDLTTTGATLCESAQAFRRLPHFMGKVLTLSVFNTPGDKLI